MKLRFSYLWIIFGVIYILGNVEKVIFYIFIMLSIHELAHLLVAAYFHYEIGTITVYPFGIGAQIYHMNHGDVYKELLIIVSGPAMHLIFPLLFWLLVESGLISHSFYEYLNLMNKTILCFNLLPIWPLDGGRILQSIFHCFFPYRFAQSMTYFCSLFNLICMVSFYMHFQLSMGIVILFLFIQIGLGLKQQMMDVYAFYRYRYLHAFRGRLKAHCYHDLYRQRENLFCFDKGYMDESQWLLQQLSKAYVMDNKHASFLI